MPTVDARQYLVGDFLIDTARYRISSVGMAVPVEPKVFDLLVYLIRHRDRVVTREELFEKVWDGRPVSDATLSNHVKSARKALGDSGELQQTIQTVRGRGYQFVAAVSEVADGADAQMGTSGSIRAPTPSGAKSRPPRKPVWVLIAAAALLLVASGFIWRPFGGERVADSNKTWLLVVPLDVYDPDAEEQQLWADELTRQLINNLSEIKGLPTKERETSFQFKTEEKTHAKIKAKLDDVRYLLGGTVESRPGRKPKVIMELYDLVEERQVWSRTYNFPRFAEDEGWERLQSTITRAVTATLEVTILEDEERTLERLGRMPTNNKQAMTQYVEGWKRLLIPDHEGLQEAVAHFNRAIELDRNFYEAYLAKGKALRYIYSYYETPKLRYPDVKEAFEKAHELRRDAAEPLSELGLINAMAWHWEEAWYYLDMARQMNDRLETTELGFAIYYSGLGQPVLAEQALQNARTIDPLNVEIADWGNWTLFLGGNVTSSRDWGIEMMDKHRSVGFIHTDAAIGAYLGGEFERAITLAQKGHVLEQSPLAKIVWAQALGYAGKKELVRPLLEEAAKSESYVCPYESAVGYLSIKDYAKAMELLKVAYEKWSNCLVFLRTDPRLEPIRTREPYRTEYLNLRSLVGLDDEKYSSYPLCRGPDGKPTRDCEGALPVNVSPPQGAQPAAQ